MVLSKQDIEDFCGEKRIPIDPPDEVIRRKNIYERNDHRRGRAIWVADWNGMTVILKSLCITEYGGLEDAWREIDLHKKIGHSKHVVKLLDYYYDTGRQVMCTLMERCEGGSLQQVQSVLSTRQLQRLFAHVLRGYRILGRHNITHRDIKPDNLLLSSSNYDEAVLKYCDFGTAKKKTGVAQTRTGTLGFLAPEVDQGLDYDPEKADVYSLGCTIHRLFQVGTKSHPEPFQTALADATENCTQKNPASRWTFEDLITSFFAKLCFEAEEEIDNEVKEQQQRVKREAMMPTSARRQEVLQDGGVTAVHPGHRVTALVDGAGLIVSRLPSLDEVVLPGKEVCVTGDAVTCFQPLKPFGVRVAHPDGGAAEVLSINPDSQHLLPAGAANALCMYPPSSGDKVKLVAKRSAEFLWSRRLPGKTPPKHLEVMSEAAVAVGWTRCIRLFEAGQQTCFGVANFSADVDSMASRGTFLLVALWKDDKGGSIRLLEAQTSEATLDKPRLIKIADVVSNLSSPVSSRMGLSLDENGYPVTFWVDAGNNAVQFVTFAVASKGFSGGSHTGRSAVPSYKLHALSKIMQRNEREMGSVIERKRGWAVKYCPGDTIEVVAASEEGNIVAIALQNKEVQVWKYHKGLHTHEHLQSIPIAKGSAVENLSFTSLPVVEAQEPFLASDPNEPLHILCVSTESRGYLYGSSSSSAAYKVMTKMDQEELEGRGVVPRQFPENYRVPVIKKLGNDCNTVFVTPPSGVKGVLCCVSLCRGVYRTRCAVSAGVVSSMDQENRAGKGWVQVHDVATLRHASPEACRAAIEAEAAAWIPSRLQGNVTDPWQARTSQGLATLFVGNRCLYIVPYDVARKHSVIPLGELDVLSQDPEAGKVVFSVRANRKVQKFAPLTLQIRPARNLGAFIEAATLREQERNLVVKDTNVMDALAYAQMQHPHLVHCFRFLAVDVPSYPPPQK